MTATSSWPTTCSSPRRSSECRPSSSPTSTGSASRTPRWPRRKAGFGGVEAYPDFATKAAALCWHLVENHALPDGNKRCAFLATVEFVERNGRTWIPAPGDPDETDRVIRGVAGGEVSESEFRDWIAEHCG